MFLSSRDGKAGPKKRLRPNARSSLLAVIMLAFTPHASSLAQDVIIVEVPAEQSEQDRETQAADAAFDQSITEFGMLAGAAYACLSKDAELRKHEARVFDAYSRIIQLFGTERAFKFASSYGYGAANRDDTNRCEDIVDKFTDKYGVIASKYALIDGD